jgi:hypothetical protein
VCELVEQTNYISQKNIWLCNGNGSKPSLKPDWFFKIYEKMIETKDFRTPKNQAQNRIWVSIKFIIKKTMLEPKWKSTTKQH